MNYREWFSFSMKNSIEVAKIKSKFSALTLKVDIFILDIPSMMDTLMKELTRHQSVFVQNTDKTIQETFITDSTIKPRRTRQIYEKIKLFSSQVIMEIASFQANVSDKKPLSQFKQKKKQANKRQREALRIVPVLKKKRTRLRSRHAYIDECLRDENGEDAFADLEDFIEC
jgi:hypothetical protein